VAPAPGGGPSTEAHVFDEAPRFGTYHSLKWAMEARALREDRLEVVVACPAACLGSWDVRVGTSALLVATARGLPVPHPDGVVSWVDVRDVALELVRLAMHPVPPPRVLFSAGLTRLQRLLEQLAGRYGVAPPPPPLSDEEALAFCDAVERRAEKEGGRPELARELADLIIHGVPLDAGLARRTLGLSFRPLSTTLDAFDDWARRVRVLPSLPREENRT
jgi:nucleoside-diphosphate-sugar epimerase